MPTDEITQMAAELRSLAGSRPGAAQAGFVTVPASDLEYIASALEALAARSPAVEGETTWGFVRQVARLDHTGDDGWTQPDDCDDAQMALDGLIAMARDILATRRRITQGGGHD